MGFYTLFNEKNFDSEIINSLIPVLVIFSATWCKPCNLLKDSLTDILNNSTNNNYKDKFKVVLIDVDQSPTITQKYIIRSVPTCMIFCNKEIKDTITGNVNIFNLLTTINKYVDQQL